MVLIYNLLGGFLTFWSLSIKFLVWLLICTKVMPSQVASIMSQQRYFGSYWIYKRKVIGLIFGSLISTWLKVEIFHSLIDKVSRALGLGQLNYFPMVIQCYLLIQFFPLFLFFRGFFFYLWLWLRPLKWNFTSFFQWC